MCDAPKVVNIVRRGKTGLNLPWNKLMLDDETAVTLLQKTDTD